MPLPFLARKAAQKAAGKRLPGAVPKATQQNAAALHRYGCNACPLNKAPVTTPKMAATLAKGAEILFLAEAPGRDEDENTGRPLTGASGRILREVIDDIRNRADHSVPVSFDNVINCRPPDNRTPVWTEVECCRPRRIKVIEQAKPKLIVGLGAVPLHWALGSTDLSGMRGRLFAIKIGQHHCHFMPTYHPSFILRIAPDKRRPLQHKLGHCLRMDIQRAFAALRHLQPIYIENEAEIRSGIEVFDGSSPDHYRRLCTLLTDSYRAPIKAIDLETTCLRPFRPGAEIISIAVSHGTTNFAFATDSRRSKWDVSQRGVLDKLFGRLLSSGGGIKIAHNSPFEIEWLCRRYGLQSIDHSTWEDTMVQAHFIDERRGKQSYGDDNKKAPYQDLDFLCKQYLGFRFKKLFKVNKKDMAKSDLQETLVYNAVDTKVTLKIYHAQKAVLKREGLLKAYEDAIGRQPTVALMQSLGVRVDQKEVLRNQAKLDRELKPVRAAIYEIKEVQTFIADRKEFNPASDRDVLVLLRDYMHRKEVAIRDGDKVRYSTDKNVLAKIKHPIGKLLDDFRNRSRLKSTYVDCLVMGEGKQIYPDGRIHCNFNTTFTETGRTSSDEPNMQNFPHRRDAWIRKQIVAPPDHVLVAADYGQLEACTMAMCTKDPVLVKALWADYDTHMEWAKKTEEKVPGLAKGDLKGFRSLIKNKLVFPAFFGASNESIHSYLENGCDTKISPVAIDDLMDEFWGTFAATKKWQDQLMKGFYDKGFVSTLVGRKHRYPLTRNEAINSPVQGTAAELVCDAMCRLSHLACTTEAWHLHPLLNIHDDLTFCVPNRVLDDALSTIIKEMLTFSYPWINVPLSIDVSIGNNWYELKKLGKFWSHRDV